MKIVVEYNDLLVYDIIVENSKIYVSADYEPDIEVLSTDTAIVTELHKYEIKNLADLFSALNKQDTVVLDCYDPEDFALVYSSELSEVDLASTEWFEYFDHSNVLMQSIDRYLIRKRCKPTTMTFAEIVKKYKIKGS